MKREERDSVLNAGIGNSLASHWKHFPKRHFSYYLLLSGYPFFHWVKPLKFGPQNYHIGRRAGLLHWQKAMFSKRQGWIPDLPTAIRKLSKCMADDNPTGFENPELRFWVRVFIHCAWTFKNESQPKLCKDVVLQLTFAQMGRFLFCFVLQPNEKKQHLS